MSVRAYRINKIDREGSSTLNCWHDSQLLDFLLDGDSWQTSSEDGVRQFEVSVQRLEEAVEAIKAGEFDEDYKDYEDAGLEKQELIKSLKRDIAWAKKKKEDYVMYDCF